MLCTACTRYLVPGIFCLHVHSSIFISPCASLFSDVHQSPVSGYLCTWSALFVFSEDRSKSIGTHTNGRPIGHPWVTVIPGIHQQRPLIGSPIMGRARVSRWCTRIRRCISPPPLGRFSILDISTVGIEPVPKRSALETSR